MNQKSRKMLDKWAEHIDDRRVIEEFLDWVMARHGIDVLSFQRDQLLNQYHGIDPKQLEQERRALLKTLRT